MSATLERINNEMQQLEESCIDERPIEEHELPDIEANLTKWIEELRSGKYEQLQGYLHDYESNKYCCLGVACQIFVPDITWHSGDSATFNYPEETGRQGTYDVMPPIAIMRSMGLDEAGALIFALGLAQNERHKYRESLTLAHLNDQEASFEVIADVISRYRDLIKIAQEELNATDQT